MSMHHGLGLNIFNKAWNASSQLDFGQLEDKSAGSDNIDKDRAGEIIQHPSMLSEPTDLSSSWPKSDWWMNLYSMVLMKMNKPNASIGHWMTQLPLDLAFAHDDIA